MKTQKTFCNSDRYIFDHDICNFKKGFAQIDTNEDASYFGNFLLPFDIFKIIFN